MDFGITGIPTITVICYLLGMGLKAVKSEELDKWIPTLCGLLGGLIAFGTMFLPGAVETDYLACIAAGIVSGFAATGLNQTVKQITK